tara:strand:- start:3997 stop:4827 length:831 start_codon:yes stop_codon:yes gene_type:complete
MAYATFEGTIEGGRPIEIYEFTAGAQSFFYTSSQDDQTVAAQDYDAVQGLKRGATGNGPSHREDDFVIDLPATNDVAQLFLGVMPGFRVRVQVSRFHRDDTPTPELVKIFDGYIQSAKFTNSAKQATLISRSELSAAGRQIPRRTFQSSCNHVLYEPNTCKVDDTDPAFKASALGVTSLVGNVLTVTAGLGGTYTDGFMNGGYVESIGVADFRLILTHVGNVLGLISAFSATPTTVNVFAGCAHTIAVCSSKFNNVIDFGGFPYVPTKNPFATGVL